MTRATRTAYSTGIRHRAGVPAYAIALAILALQAGAALHQDQHVLSDLGDTCSICLQIDQSGNALANTPITIEALPADGTGPAASGNETTATPGPSYYGRAPPVVI